MAPFYIIIGAGANKLLPKLRTQKARVDFSKSKRYLFYMSPAWKSLASKGENIYKRQARRLLASSKGKFAAIDIPSEDYFIGETLMEAFQKAKQKYPSHKFHFVRIGYPAAVSYKHRMRP